MQIYTLIILAPFLLIGAHLRLLMRQMDGAPKNCMKRSFQLNAGNYETAVSVYQKLSSRFPFGKYAQQGSLDPYAHWKNGLGYCPCKFGPHNKLYPTTRLRLCALCGLINFNENQTLFSSITGEDMKEMQKLEEWRLHLSEIGKTFQILLTGRN